MHPVGTIMRRLFADVLRVERPPLTSNRPFAAFAACRFK